MADRYEMVLAALWRNLGLGRPDTGRPRLVIDGRAVEVAPTPDGAQFIFTAAVGKLAANGPRRTEQLRRVMRDELGLVLENQACLRLIDKAGDRLEAIAVGPCRADAVPALRSRIEDLLYLVDIHAMTLDAAHTEDRRALAAPAESVILRL